MANPTSQAGINHYQQPNYYQQDDSGRYQGMVTTNLKTGMAYTIPDGVRLVLETKPSEQDFSQFQNTNDQWQAIIDSSDNAATLSLAAPETKSTIFSIARAIKEWKNYAVVAGLTEAEISAILEENPHSVDTQRMAVIRTWRRKNGSRAIWKTLAEHLLMTNEYGALEILRSRLKLSGTIPRMPAAAPQPVTLQPTAGLRQTHRDSSASITGATTHQLPPEHTASQEQLNMCPDRMEFNTLAMNISDWQALSPMFGLGEADARAILGEAPHSVLTQKMKMLDKWAERNGARATYEALYDILSRAGNTELAVKVDKMAAKAKPKSGSTSGMKPSQRKTNIPYSMPYGTHQAAAATYPSSSTGYVSRSRATTNAALQQVVADWHIESIAELIGDWRAVSPFLGLTEQEDTTILWNNCHSVEKQRIAMLEKWKLKQCGGATYQKLINVFRNDMQEQCTADAIENLV